MNEQRSPQSGGNCALTSHCSWIACFVLGFSAPRNGLRMRSTKSVGKSRTWKRKPGYPVADSGEGTPSVPTVDPDEPLTMRELAAVRGFSLAIDCACEASGLAVPTNRMILDALKIVAHLLTEETEHVG
jgi:hypothetical protein